MVDDEAVKETRGHILYRSSMCVSCTTVAMGEKDIKSE